MFASPQIINEKKNLVSKEFQLSSNNEQYLAKLILSDKIEINLNKKDSISSILYNVSLTLEDLGKINKIFKMHDTLEEAYNTLEKIFLKDKVTLHILNDNISCGFKMNSPTGDEVEIMIPLHKKEMDKSEINDKLCDEINKLKKRIKFLENENEIFKNTIKNLESRLTKIEDKNSIYEFFENFDTNIIKTNEEKKFIESMVRDKFPYKNCKFNLLYRATRDGDAISTFHSKCDNKKQILVLYHTIKGVKFGGYTDIGFDCSNKDKTDLESFLFQINKKKIYNAKGKNQIVCFGGNGPTFGDKEVAILLNDFVSILSNKINSHQTNEKISSFEGLNKFEINNGEKYFNLKELEVFQIIFD